MVEQIDPFGAPTYLLIGGIGAIAVIAYLLKPKEQTLQKHPKYPKDHKLGTGFTNINIQMEELHKKHAHHAKANDINIFGGGFIRHPTKTKHRSHFPM